MKPWKVLIVILAVPLALAVYYLITAYFLTEPEIRGQFGDMFGAMNALFSGLAFLGIIYTIWMQRDELALQREELKLTREELQRAAEAQEKSELALAKQAKSTETTAKLNGLSALLQYEIAKTDKGNKLSGSNSPYMATSMLEEDELKNIIKEIKSTLS